MSDSPASRIEQVDVQCCVVGGGPAGMMLGFLLARAGVEVAVLEKHGDFLRDFRGDTIHPSTLELIHELGLLDEFLKIPHYVTRKLSGIVGETLVTIADFSHLPTKCKYIAFMPQWDFLNFLVAHASKYPTFRVLMNAKATELIEEDGTVVGVRGETPIGPVAIRAALTVGADGRHSTIRDRAGLVVQNIGAPMDVLWLRFSRRPTDPEETIGRFVSGRIFIQIARGDYWQCGFVIARGGYEQIRERGLAAFREEVARVCPLLADRTGEVQDWNNVHLLTVAVDRLEKWHRPGLLCIGDAAHAMSPVGGVGINLAIQDAVAAANILADPLARNAVTDADLAKVQSRRTFPTVMTQRGQVMVQKRVIGRLLSSTPNETARPSFTVKLLQWLPVLQRIPGRLTGMGFRPEHIQTKDVLAPRPS